MADQAVDPLFSYFAAVAGQDGQIDARELQQCLTQSGIAGNYTPFSLEACRLMIVMLDRDYSCKMGFNEFKELWQVLNLWKNAFEQYDRDRSGTIEAHEMQAAISGIGGKVYSPVVMGIIMKRYGTTGRIPFDDFISCMVRLKFTEDMFQQRDTEKIGAALFKHEDFVCCMMYI